MEERRRWCIFTSVGDKNAIRSWLENATPRQWDLVSAYYGSNDDEFSYIRKESSYAFRTKGSKFQNLKKLVIERPQLFDKYSYICVCDDDIQMSTAQIEEIFSIVETFGFWVAQPGFHPKGKISHAITCSTWPQWDFRIVNYIEVTMPIFRSDKFAEFLAVYDGGLVGWGIDHWFSNFFKANDFGRFAIIDKIRVINPRDSQKGAREIDRLQSAVRRSEAWEKFRGAHGLVEYPHKVFSYGKLAPKNDLYAETIPTRGLPLAQRILVLLRVIARTSWREAIWLIKCGMTTRRQWRRTVKSR